MVQSRTSWVDVRDVAEAHALAFIEPAVGGERIIVSAHAFKWQDLGKYLEALWIETRTDSEVVLVARKIEGDKIPAGNTSYDPSKAKHIHVVADKGRQMLGLKYHSLEEATRHMLHEFKCRGWIS